MIHWFRDSQGFLVFVLFNRIILSTMGRWMPPIWLNTKHNDFGIRPVRGDALDRRGNRFPVIYDARILVIGPLTLSFLYDGRPDVSRAAEMAD